MSTVQSQTVPANAKPADYSTEPYVIEKRVSKLNVERDGTYTTDTTIRVRLQSQAGIQQFGIVSEPYASSTSTVQMVYARAIAPDGKVIETPAENVLDLPSRITQQVPFYSDLKVVQAAVKGLTVGDTLEYEFRGTSKAIDPGQFWFEWDFFKEGVALDDELEVSTPQGLDLKVKSPDVHPSTEQSNGRTVYLWKTAHLESAGASTKSAAPAKHPDVQLTTFHSWNEVGAWFNALAAPQAVATPDVRAKALELTSNAKTDQEKIRVLYQFVSEKYRYIGIDFGIGRYQPHAAGDVMSNDYGDCKDKHTLFAALLASVGIKAYPALISAEDDVDTDVPSPAQFDHVITAIPQGGGYQFLDTTPEVAPYGYLIATIRGKQALVIPDAKTAAFVETPTDPPFESFLNFTADATLDSGGTLVSKMEMSMRGDVEVGFRIALRQIGEPQWNQAVQNISQNLGFSGTVTDASISKIDSSEDPLGISYTYTRKTFGDWDNKRAVAPLPIMFLPAAPDESDKDPQPLDLGSPVKFFYKGTMELPVGSNPELPEPVSLHESFADYDASYSISDNALHVHILHVQRTLSTKLKKVPVDQLDSYRKFFKLVSDDYGVFIPLDSQRMVGSSRDADAQSLFDAAVKDFQTHDMNAAVAKLHQAVVKDPNFAQAWYALGLQDAGRDPDQAVIELKKAGSVDLSNLLAAKGAANELSNMHRQDDALGIWKAIEAKNPDDEDTHSHIVGILTQQKRYSDAIPELQELIRLHPQNYWALANLGDAYLHIGNKDQGIAAINKALAVDRSPDALNDVAWVYAENNLNLDEALEDAQEAVKELEEETDSIELDALGPQDLGTAASLSAYWDTLAWVQYRLGHFSLAEEYDNAAWNLTQDAAIAVHLGEIYEKDGKLHEAAVSYARGAAVGGSDARSRLDALHAKGHVGAGESPDPVAIQNLRTFKLPRVYSGSANARFLVLLPPGGKAVDAKFVGGDERLHDNGEVALKAFKFDVPFPSGSSAQMLRTGFLNCESVVPECTFVLIPVGTTIVNPSAPPNRK